MTDPTQLPRSEITTLLAIMRSLRDPKAGCPWDIEQTLQTIAPYTIEEAYEVADAIAQSDMDGLRDELGDLLLQVVYHSQICAEQGHFDFADTVEAINSKMIRRHPHVFGNEDERKTPPAAGFWEKMKSKEQSSKPQTGVLTGIPSALPALTRAVKLQDKAARANFDWPDINGVLDKIEEEIGELREAQASGSTSEVLEEFGDLMFALVNFARHKGIDPEQALRNTNLKFTKRFNYIEQHIENANQSMTDKSLQELDKLWNEAKIADLD